MPFVMSDIAQSSELSAAGASTRAARATAAAQRVRTRVCSRAASAGACRTDAERGGLVAAGRATSHP